MRFVKGWARKAAIPVLCISALGWIVYVVGCSLLHSEQGSILGTGYSTPFWLFVASGPPLYVLSTIYLLTGNSIVGLATNFFTIVSLVSSGAAMWYTGLFIQFAPSGGYTSDLQLYQSCVTMFSGCLVSVLFLAISVLLSPFFIINTPECCMNLSEEDRVAFGRQLPQPPQQPQPAGYMMQPMYIVPQTSNQPQAIPVVQAAVVPISYQPAMDVGAETKP